LYCERSRSNLEADREIFRLSSKLAELRRDDVLARDDRV